ncbi:hydroxyacylglutathione hydrolase [Salinicola rhizosphaerae]|uniref:Hydroxyacylglutathione hydrolase n=1 Tax=Salinicola rhizosphaerae TaxID=1443141 RepID=A0ABQ3DN53_9GAMM|nr:hydroxyacylglutathione hydrolase [Salinicola rhizosphaerae]GHB08763.1 hydroxyacylglutathione hydrolase [Salinicola rhizosphaerae]
MLTVIPIPAFQDNYIWLLRQDTAPGVAVVDPGDAEPVIAWLERENLTLDTVLITHHHQDHTGGLQTLIERYSPTVYGPDNPAIAGIQHTLGDGDECRVLGRRFEIFAVPGHTLDHIAFYASGTPTLLFAGDTLFSAGCGRCFEGTAQQMQTSLGKFDALADDTLVFAAHEYTLANLAFATAAEPDNPARDAYHRECEKARGHDRPTLPTTLGRERQINPFLRIDQPGIRATLAEQGPADDRESAFATLRAWKDRF